MNLGSWSHDEYSHSAALVALAAFGAAGQSPMKTSGMQRFVGPSEAQIKVQALDYGVASRQDLSIVMTEASSISVARATRVTPVRGRNQQAAISLMKIYTATHPELAHPLQVVPSYKSKELVTR